MHAARSDTGWRENNLPSLPIGSLLSCYPFSSAVLPLALLIAEESGGVYGSATFLSIAIVLQNEKFSGCVDKSEINSLKT